MMKIEENIGITLISLVITIIILLILAGVSINTLMGENGVLTKTQEARVEYEISEEKEQVEIFVVSKLMNEKVEVDSSENLIGTKLTDRVVGINNTLWKTVTEMKEGTLAEAYGTEWYYIEEGTEIEGIGNLKYSYIVNYKTGKVIKFDSSKHTILSNDKGLAIKRNLIFNLDPSNMSGNVEDWGDNVELHGFNDGISGYQGTRFSFDGTDDYISIYTGDDFLDGFTVEVYGNSRNTNMAPLISKQRVGSTATSFRISLGGNASKWNSCLFNLYGIDCGSNWKLNDSNNSHNMALAHDFGLYNSNFYITMTFNPETLTVSIYNNGVFIDSTTVYESYWENSRINIFENNQIPLNFGIRTGGNIPVEYTYFSGDIYSARIYNTHLNSQEVLENYNATVSYHELLTK